MNFRKLLTYLTMGTAAAMPIATAQNPTILQGSYVSNVFGNSNFVLNPNALTNVANVAVSNATVTRSTTTPLVATSEFLVTVTSANGTIAWNTRTFDQGMKGQNCEARFTYRGFQSTSVAQVRQGATVAGANVVARLALTASTDPRIASINFPCGDLSQPTYFVITDTATLSGTNEIGGIYVGLATNQANVAQAEFVGSLTVTGCSGPYVTPINTSSYSTAWSQNVPTGCIYTATGNLEAPTNTAKPGFKLKYDKAGTYFVSVEGTVGLGVNVGAGSAGHIRIQNGSINSSETYFGDSTSTTSFYPGGFKTTINYTTTGDPLFYFAAKTGSNVYNVYGVSSLPLTISVYRFPSSSELVVTPERQNVWGGVVYTDEEEAKFIGAAANSTYSQFNNAVWNQPTKLKGRAKVTTTDSGNNLGFSIEQLPVGNYKLEISGFLNASNNGAAIVDAKVRCNFRIFETTTSTEVARQQHQDISITTGTGEQTRDYTNSFAGIFNNTSVATRNFRLEANKYLDDNTPTPNGACQAFSDTSATSNSNITFLITPLDQPSNSALYVQGPVLGAQTGATIPSGYVGEQINSNTSATITNNTGATTNLTSFSLNPGFWQIEASCIYRSNSTTATSGWNFAAVMIADASNSSSGTDVMSYVYTYLGHVTLAGQYAPLFMKRYVSVTTPTTYYVNTETVYTANNPTIQCALKRTRLN